MDLVSFQKTIDRGIPPTMSELDILLRANDINKEFKITWYNGLKNGVINPDESLVSAINHLGCDDQVDLIAFSLRFGADTNIYLNKKHLAVYTFELVPRKYVNLLFILFITFNSNFNQPAIESNPLTVYQWLDENNYTTFDNVSNENININFNDKLIHNACILADKNIFPESYKGEGRKVKDEEMEEIISLQDNNIIVKITERETGSNYREGKLFKGMDYVLLYYCIRYYNEISFNHYLNMGYRPSYALMTHMIFKMNHEQNRDHVLTSKILERMIISSINHGTDIDLFQLESIQDKLLRKEIEDNYASPYWSRICNNGTNGIPDFKFKLLAYHLDLNPEETATELCEKIKIISEMKPEDVVKANIRKQKLILATKLSPLTSFTTEKIPEIEFKNISVQKNPFEYSRLDIVAYHDSKLGNLIFTSDMYSYIIDKKYDTINKIKVPEYIIDEMKYKREIIFRITGNKTMNPVPIGEAIRDLNQKYYITNNITERINEKYSIYKFSNNAMIDILLKENVIIDFYKLYSKQLIYNIFNHYLDFLNNYENAKYINLLSRK